MAGGLVVGPQEGHHHRLASVGGPLELRKPSAWPRAKAVGGKDSSCPLVSSEELVRLQH